MKKTLLTTIFATMAFSQIGTPASVAPTSYNTPTELSDYFSKPESFSEVAAANGYSYHSNIGDISEAKEFDKIPELPHYKTSGKNCSGYVRKAGKKLFGKTFSWTDAWNRRYMEDVVYEFKPENKLAQLDSLKENNILEPGMILGTYFKSSRYNKKRDWHGKKAKYTHVLLYVGKDSTQNHYFMHEWGKKQELISFEGLKELKLELKEVLDENQLLATKS